MSGLFQSLTTRIAAVWTTLATPSGSGLIGWIRSAVGAVLRTLQSKLSEDVPSVFDFMTAAQIADVLSGAPALDHTDAIENALAAHSAPSFGTWPNKFRVSRSITLSDNQQIRSWGARIQQITAQTPIFDITGKTGCRFHGTRYIGVGTDYVDSSSSLARAISGTNAVDTVISWNTFSNFAYSSFYGEGVNGFTFAHNKVTGPGLSVLTPGVSRNNTGVTVGGTGIDISHNDISLTGQGLILAQGSSNVVINTNRMHDILVEHGMYLDTGISNVAVTGNALIRCYQNGIKMQWYDAYGVTPEAVVIANNSVVTTTTGDGILVLNSTGAAATIYATNVSITGNTVSDAGQDAISARNLFGGNVANNLGAFAGRHGIYLEKLQKTDVKNNVIRSTQENGIYVCGAVNSLHIERNKLYLSGLANIAANGRNSALFTATTSEIDFVISENRIVGDNTKTKYGIYISTGTKAQFEVTENDVKDVSDFGMRLDTTDAMGRYAGNVWTGVLGAVFNEPVLPTIASASNLVMTAGQDTFFISGTTTIDSITAPGCAGRRVTLIFLDVGTVVDGANLYLAGSFTSSANDTLSLVSDGNYWYETGRSAN